MKWRCKFCGFKIKEREDKRRVNIKQRTVYIMGFCDSCSNWSILYSIPIEKVRDEIKKLL